MGVRKEVLDFDSIVQNMMVVVSGNGWYGNIIRAVVSSEHQGGITEPKIRDYVIS